MVNADNVCKYKLKIAFTLVNTSKSANSLGASSSPKGLESGDFNMYCLRAWSSNDAWLRVDISDQLPTLQKTNSEEQILT